MYDVRTFLQGLGFNSKACLNFFRWAVVRIVRGRLGPCFESSSSSFRLPSSPVTEWQMFLYAKSNWRHYDQFIRSVYSIQISNYYLYKNKTGNVDEYVQIMTHMWSQNVMTYLSYITLNLHIILRYVNYKKLDRIVIRFHQSCVDQCVSRKFETVPMTLCWPG